MIFLSCPPIYTLPGTWQKFDPETCKAYVIPHANLSGGAAYAVFLGLFVLALVVYGIYLTFGPGKEELRDQIDEHAKMHELGIAHGHGGKSDAYKIAGKLEHKHEDK
tara:strand:+ start:1982 stop:2302 length:321 start_codon:yes stop_codon:yes gene_type:complete